MIRILGATIIGATLMGCADGQSLTTPLDVPIEASRYYADLFQDQPFDTATVTVLATERGELRSYNLTPCQNGARICGVRTGTLQKTPDYYVVSGAYAGRTFHLSPGGDGFMRVNGESINIAWN